jgi:hypothetical protein
LFPDLNKYFIQTEYKPVSVTAIDRSSRYPFSLRNYYTSVKIRGIINSAGSCMISRLRKPSFDNLGAYCRFILGDYFFKTSGLKNYIERLTGMPVEQIDPIFMQFRMGFLKNLSLKKIARELLFKRVNINSYLNYGDLYIRKNISYSEIFKSILNDLKSKQVSVSLGTTVKSIKKNYQRFIVRTNDFEKIYDEVFVSTSIDQTSAMLSLPLENIIPFRSMLSLFFIGEMRVNSGIIYNFSNKGDWKRITVFSHYYGKSRGSDYFTVEVTVDFSKEEVSDNVIKNVIDDILEKNIVSNIKLVGKELIPYAYPVYDITDYSYLCKQIEIIRETGVRLIGRQGNHQYISSSAAVARTCNTVEEYEKQLS